MPRATTRRSRRAKSVASGGERSKAAYLGVVAVNVQLCERRIDAERLGEEFTGKISGIARFGVFVKLDETGADGLVPMRALGREYFHFDPERGTLMGADTGRIIALGQRVTVRLAEAAPVSGGLAFDLLDIEGSQVPKGEGTARGKPPRRKIGAARRKSAKLKRKAERKRG